LVWVTQIGFYREVFSKAFNRKVRGAQGSARGQAALPGEPGYGAYRTKDSRSIEQRKFIDKMGTQAGPVDHRSSLDEEAGDQLGTKYFEDAIEIGAALVRELLTAGRHGFDLDLLHPDAARLQGAALIFLGK
jgi:hypothetical protein